MDNTEMGGGRTKVYVTAYLTNSSISQEDHERDYCGTKYYVRPTYIHTCMSTCICRAPALPDEHRL
jgi:hypothetical protein